jgi:uncharacterized protein (DUF433 family)
MRTARLSGWSTEAGPTTPMPRHWPSLQFGKSLPVGTKLSLRDVLSPQAHAAGEITVERLDEFDHEQGDLRAALIEDRRATPADTAAARIDVAAWLRSLSHRSRRIAMTLAMGETTSDVARQFKVSPARISQMREELKTSWESFHERGQHQAGGACPHGQVAISG